MDEVFAISSLTYKKEFHLETKIQHSPPKFDHKNHSNFYLQNFLILSQVTRHCKHGFLVFRFDRVYKICYQMQNVWLGFQLLYIK